VREQPLSTEGSPPCLKYTNLFAAGHVLTLEAVIRPLPNASGAFNFGRVRFQHLLLVLPQQYQISATHSVPIWEH